MNLTFTLDHWRILEGPNTESKDVGRTEDRGPFVMDSNHFVNSYLYSLGIAATSAKISNFKGLATLTFNLLTCKWGHGSPASWASLLPNFTLLCPSVLGFGSGTGQRDRQTDRQTDRQQSSLHNAPTLWGRRHNKMKPILYRLMRSEIASGAKMDLTHIPW